MLSPGPLDAGANIVERLDVPKYIYVRFKGQYFLHRDEFSITACVYTCSYQMYTLFWTSEIV